MRENLKRLLFSPQVKCILSKLKQTPKDKGAVVKSISHFHWVNTEYEPLHRELRVSQQPNNSLEKCTEHKRIINVIKTLSVHYNTG